MKRLVLFAALLLPLLLTAPTFASSLDDVTSEMCSSTFPERHADAIQAINAQAHYMAEYTRVMPWFDANCRMLTGLERAIRRIDDPAAFVCKTQKGRPKELTSEFIQQHSQPADIVIFQDRYHDNDVCEPYDARERISLVLREPPPDRKLAVYCFQSTSPKCAPVLEQLAAAKVKVKS